MDYYQKVVWGEGMLLTPQHFQQGDRYFEHLLHRRIKGIQALDWGLCSLEVDNDAITGGAFELSAASGVMPDGLWFDLPNQDQAPSARPIEEFFPAGTDKLGVYLGVAKPSAGQMTCLVSDTATAHAATTYEGGSTTVRDETDTAREQEIVVARKRLRILYEGESLENFSCIKVAELSRTATGSFEPNKNFIPSCLYLSASGMLMSVLRRVLDIMAKRSEDLSAQRRQRSRGLAEFTMSEAANFWFLHTLNGHIPAVASLFRLSRVHPVNLYHELAALAGELYTFSSEGHPRDIPPYDHEDLTSTFATLVGQLRSLMGTVLATRCAPVPLERVRESVWMARINDDRFLSAKLVLAVKADVPAQKVVKELPPKAKLSSADRVQDLIVQALPGIPIGHLATPPSEIPVQPGRIYFQMAQQGDHWDAVKASRSLAIYVPADFVGLQLELMAVME